jgi:flagellar biosynthesis protein FliR
VLTYAVALLPAAAGVCSFLLTFAAIRSSLPFYIPPAAALIIAAGISSGAGVEQQELLSLKIVSALIHGVLIAAPYALTLELVPTAFRLLELMQGSHIAEQITLSEDRGALFEPVARLLPFVIFIELGFHHRPLAELASRLYFAPLDERGIGGVLSLSQEVLTQSVVVSASMLTVGAILDVAAGIMSRMIPGLQVSSELQSLKLLTGAAIAAALMSDASQGYWAERFSTIFEGGAYADRT